jgi:hypothetical protein
MQDLFNLYFKKKLINNAITILINSFANSSILEDILIF